MKRIIRKNRILPKWIVNCPYCDTQFEYQSEDIEFLSTGVWVRCPLCDKYLNHSNSCQCTMDRVDTMQI